MFVVHGTAAHERSSQPFFSDHETSSLPRFNQREVHLKLSKPRTTRQTSGRVFKNLMRKLNDRDFVRVSRFSGRENLRPTVWD